MCTLNSCSIQREEGFPSAFVIAHEMGHVIGMSHDGDPNQSNECQDDTQIGSVMAPLVQSKFHKYRWSHCSNREMKESLKTLACLNKPIPADRTTRNPDTEEKEHRKGKDIKIKI